MASGRRVAEDIISKVMGRSLQFQCIRVLHKSLLVAVLICGSETMPWEEYERYRIRAVQMANLRGLLGIRRMDKVPNP